MIVSGEIEFKGHKFEVEVNALPDEYSNSHYIEVETIHYNGYDVKAMVMDLMDNPTWEEFLNTIREQLI
jgi:hypothetical protein